MASQEPESQIVPPDYDSEEFIPSSPPFPTYMAPQNADSSHARPHTSDEIPESQHADFQPDSYASRVGETQFESVEIDKQAVEASHKTDNGHSRYHAGDRAPESQHADFQPDSYASHIRETQFQSIEMDTQAVENLNFPDIHQNSQLREVTTPTAPLSAMSQAIPLLSRPGPGHLDDIADGFTFTRFDKPEKGKFNRPPIPTKPQRVAEKPSVEDQLNGKFHLQAFEHQLKAMIQVP
jgi:hypothetical protein